MAVQPDGKIVLVGRTQPQFGAVARLGPSGRRDPGFGDDGIVVDRRFSAFTAVALQPDGSILAAAPQGGDSGARPILARYLADGSPDPSFGVGGEAEFAGHPVGGFSPVALALRPDGGILVGGTYRDGRESPTRALVELFGADGSDLGTVASVPPRGGSAPRGLEEWTAMTDLLPRPDGSLVMAGTTSGFLGGESVPLLAASSRDPLFPMTPPLAAAPESTGPSSSRAPSTAAIAPTR